MLKIAKRDANAAFNPVSMFSCDTETSGLNMWQQDAAFAVSLCDEEGNTWYCCWEINASTREVTPRKSDLVFLQKLFSSDLTAIFFNRSFDCKMLAKAGLKITCRCDDASISARIFNNLEPSFRLKPLCEKYLGIPDTDQLDLKKAVDNARRKARVLNKTHSEKIALGDHPEQDYWLVKYLDPTSTLCETYARLDAFRTLGLWLFHQEQFAQDPILQKGYDEEFAVMEVVDSMEHRGIKVNPDTCRAQGTLAIQDAKDVMREMLEIIKERGLKPTEESIDWNQHDLERMSDEDMKELFNPASSPQLQRVLFLPEASGGLGLNPSNTILGERRNKVGLSCDKNALKALAHNPMVQKIIRYRASKQALSLFFDKYVELMTKDHIEAGAWCLHPGFNSCGAVTYRFSSSSPNLQQVTNPKGSDSSVSYNARITFEPRRGYSFLSFDYIQQELRIFASVANIRFLKEEIAAGRDPNSACANRAWGGKGNESGLRSMSYALDLGKERPSNDEVAAAWKKIGWNKQAAKDFGYYHQRSLEIADAWLAKYDYDIVHSEGSLGRKNCRTRAKMINFAKIYGGGASAVVAIIFCTLKEAKQFMAEYDKAIPELKEYSREMIKQAKADGYIINPFGRKLRIDPEYAYRCVNYCIQSAASSLVKMAMVKSHRFLKETGLDIHLLLSIHDELDFEARIGQDTKPVLRKLAEIMCDTEGCISVPMAVDVERCYPTWFEKEPIDLTVKRLKVAKHGT